MSTRKLTRIARWAGVLLLGLSIIACTPQPAGQTPAPTAAHPVTASQTPSASTSSATFTPTPRPTASSTAVPALDPTQVAQVFPLAARGPYLTGVREFVFIDAARAGREVRVTVIYPALEQTDAEGRIVRQDAPADMSAAPYPLVLTGTNSGDNLFKSHLASHGIVTAIVRYPPMPDLYNEFVLDFPLDIVFALDQLSGSPLEGLEGVIDTDRAGVGGYSIDGFTALGVSGARLDPEYYLERCTQAPALEPPLSDFWLKYYCDLAGRWESFATYAGAERTDSDDGLWQPVTDPRILAVLPMAPDGVWLYGPRGLEAIERPVMILTGSEDQLSFYEMETVFLFEHLDPQYRFLITFLGEGHMMVFDPGIIARLNHFATAFFGYYLDGRAEYAQYFSEDFVAGLDDLFWGVFEGE